MTSQNKTGVLWLEFFLGCGLFFGLRGQDKGTAGVCGQHFVWQRDGKEWSLYPDQFLRRVWEIAGTTPS